jgi:fructan beta-fructosidase
MHTARSHIALSLTLALVACSGSSADANTLARTTAPRAADSAPDDPYRPRIHFAPARNWINDPNGPVFVNGRYHLFYQTNPTGNVWGNIAWGHASSSDLFVWIEHPVAIPRTDSTMIFSGGVVVDSLGTAGFCTGPLCLVAIYTAAHEQTRQQSQSLAYSTDGGATWSQYNKNPVLEIGSTEFRDPFVFWHAPSRAWIMAVAMATEHTIRLYRSTTLRTWQLASEFGGVGATGGVWECPVLTELPILGGNTRRWMLKVDLNPGHVAGGSGAQYFTGTFDGQQFVADDTTTRWVDFGPDFYCAQPWQPANADGSSTWIAWMSSWKYAGDTPTGDTPTGDTPTGNWRGMMSLPRIVSLREREGRTQLVQQPLNELATLRGSVQQFTVRNTTIPDATVLDIDAGRTFEAELTIVPGSATEVGLMIRHSTEQHVLISYDPVRSRVAIDRRPGGTTFHPDFATRAEAPVARGSLVTLRIVVDASSVELFADGGATVLSALMFPSPNSRNIALFTKGGPVQSVSLSVWTLRASALNK